MTATAPYGVEVLRKGNPKTSLDRNRTAPQPSPTDSLTPFVHPPTEQVLSSPHSVTSFPCEDTVRARSEKPFARLTHGYAVRLRGFPAHGSCLPVRTFGGLPLVDHPMVTLATFTKTSHDACSWLSLRSSTLASARRGGGRERLYAATRGKAGKRLAFGLTLYTPLPNSRIHTDK